MLAFSNFFWGPSEVAPPSRFRNVSVSLSFGVGKHCAFICISFKLHYKRNFPCSTNADDDVKDQLLDPSTSFCTGGWVATPSTDVSSNYYFILQLADFGLEEGPFHQWLANAHHLRDVTFAVADVVNRYLKYLPPFLEKVAFERTRLVFPRRKGCLAEMTALSDLKVQPFLRGKD